MASLKLIDVCKVYKGNVLAVKDFNLEIKDGEFLVFVGPSGCGKSTTLRMIAGLEDITSGKVFIDDLLINHLEPKDRDIAMVFQNYALYPHMSVYENLAYSLRCHHVDKNIVDEKVNEVAKTLDIAEYLYRKPKELSGGQRQRVALGRCLIRSPKVYLFDEPLSNLDAKLRVSMRSEISKLHKKVKGTFIYVTHDQTEAMTMGDRIVVMKNGIIQQVDTPVNLYEHPSNVFVATFLGSPQMNIFKVHLKDDKLYFKNGFSISLTPKMKAKIIDGYDDKDLYLGIRPSDFEKADNMNYDIHIENVELVEKLGNETLVHFMMDDVEALASLKLSITDDIKDDLYLKIDYDKLHLFNMEEESILKINDINYIDGSVLHQGNDYLIEGLIIPDYQDKCINDKYLESFDCYYSIKSSDFKLEKGNNDLEFVVKTYAYDIYSDKKVFYAKDLHDSRITFFTDKDYEFDLNKDVKLYVNIDKVGICNKDYDSVIVDEAVNKPIIDINIRKIKRDYYIETRNSSLAKNKYFIIEKIFDLGKEMIINTKNHKNELFSFRLDKNPNLYVGMVLNIRLIKA